MHVTRTRSLGLIGLFLFAACGDEGLNGDPSNPFEDPGAGYDGASYGSDTAGPTGDAPIVGQPDTGSKPDAGSVDTAEPPHDIVTPTGACTLEFTEATGDDGAACKGASECNLTLFFSGSRSVKVRYLCDGAPLASGLVQFDLIGNEANSTLEALPNAVYTDADGTAATTVNVANNNAGLFELRASPGDGSDAQPISYMFSVESKIGPPLTVKFNPLYDPTQVKFDKIETTIYKHTDANKYECAGIDPTETMPSGGVGLPKVSKIEESVVAPSLPKLDTELHQKWTVVAVGKTTAGAMRIVGCNDQDAKVEFAKSTIVTVDMNAVPPDYTGEYAATAYLDLTSALPPNIKLIFDVIFGLFESPTGGLMLLVCKLDGNSLDSICEIVFDDPDNPVIGEWGSFGEIIVTTADAILIGLLDKNPIAKDIFHTGKDLGEILQHLELHSRIIMKALPPKKKAVPDSQGWFTEDQCSQVWDEITFTWTLNAGCNPNDPGCGQQNFNFNQFSNGVLSATFEAQVTPTFYDMNIYEHSVNLKYGALLNEVIKQLLLPAVFGDGSDGFPKIDSYEEVIQTFLCGKEGMMPGQDCCQIFADNIGVGAIEGTLKTACKSLIPLGVSYLEGLLLGLDLDVNNLHLKTAEPCKLYDVDADGKIDSFGKADKPCYWALELEVFGFTAAFDAEFFAVRKN